jgi:excisionase family DNA binding protein
VIIYITKKIIHYYYSKIIQHTHNQYKLGVAIMDELFTIREVAKKMKISVSSVYRYVETGRFPHTKIGTNIRFTEDHIKAFLSDNQEETNQVKLSQDEYYENIPSQAEILSTYDFFNQDN